MSTLVGEWEKIEEIVEKMKERDRGDEREGQGR